MPNLRPWRMHDRVKFAEVKTHFVGASCSSMSPLMNVAMLPAAALVSSAVFDIVSLLSSSSRTLIDFWFSDFVLAALEGTVSMMSSPGIMMVSKFDRFD